MTVCERCGTKYEPYTVLLCDDPTCMAEYISIMEDWPNGVCPGCRAALGTGACNENPAKIVEATEK